MMRQMDLGSGAFLLFLSIFAMVESFKLGFGTMHRPGSGFLPFLAASVLGSLSLYIFLKAVRKRVKTEGEVWENPKGWPKMTLVLAVLLGFAFTMEKIGFLVAAFLLLLLLVKAIQPQSWPKALVFSFLGSVLCYLLFQTWLKAQLPSGILNFR